MNKLNIPFWASLIIVAVYSAADKPALAWIWIFIALLSLILDAHTPKTPHTHA